MIFKSIIFVSLFLITYGLRLPVVEPEIQPKRAHLLGSNECTWGPSYWCNSLQSAHSCKAVKHCIKKVWATKTVPEDNDDICTICKNMVQQARDQLESNETMDELRQVLEGSCKLIYIKPIVKECEKLADEFVPELVETLSSEMNPDVVCSVAGLCNNATIDKMIADYKSSQPSNEPTTERVQQCNSCNTIVAKIEKKFKSATEEEVLHRFLSVCGQFGSYSDACATVIFENFDQLYQHLQQNLNPKSVCHLSGTCSFVFHKHESKHVQVEVQPESKIGVVRVSGDMISVTVKDQAEDKDEECDMCVQLVGYLRSILIANTTESEFELVLKGLCKQTGKFAPQCLSIVEEYYRQIYGFLVDELNGKSFCSMISLCPRPQFDSAPIWPLLPEPAAPVPVHKKPISYGDVSADPSTMQLPIERIFTGLPGGSAVAVENKNVCLFCEYFLHYIQQFISQPVEEENIKKYVFEACDKLPKSVQPECKQFVDLYGNAFIAILVEEIDPSQVCPSLGLCPSKISEDRDELIPITLSKPACPLCLLAIEELDKKLKDNKTEASVRQALDNLCSSLPNRLVKECDELVQQYTEELIDMMIADFTPQEVCIYLKLCPVSVQLNNNKDQEIQTNEIPQYVDHTDLDKTLITVQMFGVKRESTVCIICEFALSKIDDSLRENATEEEIKEAVHNICNHLPKTVSKECNQFVNTYSDAVIEMLIQSLDPLSVCTQIKLCQAKVVPNMGHAVDQSTLVKLHQVVEQCAVCEAAVGAINGLLEDKDVDQDISNIAARVCPLIPNRERQCRQLLDAYGARIVAMIVDMGIRPGVVCYKLHLCDEAGAAKVQLGDSAADTGSKFPPGHLIGGNRCTWGPSYWCQSEDHANSCGTIQHCRERVWKNDKPQTKE